MLQDVLYALCGGNLHSIRARLISIVLIIGTATIVACIECGIAAVIGLVFPQFKESVIHESDKKAHWIYMGFLCVLNFILFDFLFWGW